MDKGKTPSDKKTTADHQGAITEPFSLGFRWTTKDGLSGAKFLTPMNVDLGKSPSGKIAEPISDPDSTISPPLPALATLTETLPIDPGVEPSMAVESRHVHSTASVAGSPSVDLQETPAAPAPVVETEAHLVSAPVVSVVTCDEEAPMDDGENSTTEEPNASDQSLGQVRLKAWRAWSRARRNFDGGDAGRDSAPVGAITGVVAGTVARLKVVTDELGKKRLLAVGDRVVQAPGRSAAANSIGADTASSISASESVTAAALRSIVAVERDIRPRLALGKWPTLIPGALKFVFWFVILVVAASIVGRAVQPFLELLHASQGFDQ